MKTILTILVATLLLSACSSQPIELNTCPPIRELSCMRKVRTVAVYGILCSLFKHEADKWIDLALDDEYSKVISPRQFCEKYHNERISFKNDVIKGCDLGTVGELQELLPDFFKEYKGVMRFNGEKELKDFFVSALSFKDKAPEYCTVDR